MPESNRNLAVHRTATMGLLLALALVLSLVESMLPALPLLPVGVKLGLSNIVTMFCLFSLDAKSAWWLAGLKSFFVLLTRGPIAAALSAAGGAASVLTMLAGKRLGGTPLVLSINGAIAHNLGQLSMAAILLKSIHTFYYFPVMVFAGIGMGALTGILLRFVSPYLQSVDRAMK